MKIIMLITIFLISCSPSDKQQFVVVNPVSLKEDSWVRHEGLPQFNAELHSDGCSGGMSAIYAQLKFLHKNYGDTLVWRECCVIHDEAYYYGGTIKEKKQADTVLGTCVTESIGKEYIGTIMQAAVKLGGGPNLPTSYRWGYGEDFREDVHE